MDTGVRGESMSDHDLETTPDQKPTHVVACAMNDAPSERDRRVIASMCVRPDQARLAEVVLGLMTREVRICPVTLPPSFCKPVRRR